jgi:hypothetical protein
MSSQILDTSDKYFGAHSEYFGAIAEITVAFDRSAIAGDCS